MREKFTTMFQDGKNCQNCTERYVGCHSSCEIYLAAIKRWEEHKKEVNEKKSVAQNYERFRRSNVIKSIKKSNS